jgi:hypothetical protein
MGPGAELEEGTVSESVMTGRHFLGCAEEQVASRVSYVWSEIGRDQT